MSTILEINNWEQLVRAKSDYDNLGILVSNFNNSDTVGTQITIADKNTNYIYFRGFVVLTQSGHIPLTAKFTNEQMVDIVNSYGFHVALSTPYVVTQTVMEILQGLYSSGYRYIYKDYKCKARYTEYGIYATDQLKMRMSDLMIKNMPTFIENEWDWCKPNTSYAIEDILRTGTVDNGIPI